MAKSLTVVLVASLAISPVLAQVLRDPTQPPAAYTAASGSVFPEADSGETAERVLQSIVRRHGARPVAVINGQRVPLGGKIDDWVVVRIGENDVVLSGPGGKETLAMSPNVEKQPVRPVVIRKSR